MCITFFPRLWHGNCVAFTAAGHGSRQAPACLPSQGGRSPAREIAENARLGGLVREARSRPNGRTAGRGRRVEKDRDRGKATAKRHGLQRSPEGVQQRTRTQRAPFLHGEDAGRQRGTRNAEFGTNGETAQPLTLRTPATAGKLRKAEMGGTAKRRNGTAFTAENAEGELGSGNDEIYPPEAGPNDERRGRDDAKVLENGSSHA
jgi:hypothetical protein